MKVSSVLLVVVFTFTTNIFSQVQFTPHTITTAANGAFSVYAVDIDGNGDMDVLSGSGGDDKIAWYENLNHAGIVNNDPPVPNYYTLDQNYPNPFNSSTTICHSIEKPTLVSLKIFDLQGRAIKTLVNEYQVAKMYSITLDALELASSIFYYQLQVGSEFTETKKMVLLR